MDFAQISTFWEHLGSFVEVISTVWAFYIVLFVLRVALKCFRKRITAWIDHWISTKVGDFVDSGDNLQIPCILDSILSLQRLSINILSASKTYLQGRVTQKSNLVIQERFCARLGWHEQLGLGGPNQAQFDSRIDPSPRMAWDSIFSKVVRTRIFSNPLILDHVGVK